MKCFVPFVKLLQIKPLFIRLCRSLVQESIWFPFFFTFFTFLILLYLNFFLREDGIHYKLEIIATETGIYIDI